MISKKEVKIPFDLPTERTSERAQKRIYDCLYRNVEACSGAAAIWARLHYGHASYVDGSLKVKSVDFSSDDSGKAALSFDWTFQDGCSDICREGDGYVDVDFSVSDGQLNLKWAWPEKASTVDEF